MPGLADRAKLRRSPSRAGTNERISRRRVLALAAILVCALIAAAILVWTTRGGAAADGAGQKISGRPPILIDLPAGVAPGAASARVTALESFVRSHPTDGDALIALGAAQAELGQMTQAEQSIVTAGHLGSTYAFRAAAALSLLDFESLGDKRAVASLDNAAKQQAKDPFIRLAQGVGELYAGEATAARTDLAAARKLDPEGYYGSSADDLLHPEQRPGYPEFVYDSSTIYTSDAQARAAAKAHPTDMSVLLAAAAELQTTSRLEALELAQQAQTVVGTGDALAAQVAVAILGYKKDDPAGAAGQLGPLVAANPDSASARFHFGLLLFWFNRTADAHAQFLAAAADEHGTKLSQLAQAFANGTANAGPPSTMGPLKTTG